MPQPHVRVYNPVGRHGFTSLKSARRDVKRGRAHWREVDRLIDYTERPRSVPRCLSAGLPVKRMQINLKVAAVDAQIYDSNLAQTFLSYPQRSLDSYGSAFPGLAQRNAGLG